MAGTLPGDLVEHMHGPAKRCVLDAKDMARKKIFQDKRKTLHEIGAYTTLEILLKSFCGAALEQHGGKIPSFKNRRILDLLGNNAPDPNAKPFPLRIDHINLAGGYVHFQDLHPTAAVDGGEVHRGRLAVAAGLGLVEQAAKGIENL